MTTSLALDLGTTRIKLGILRSDGGFRLLKSASSPPLSGQGGKRISDPDAYRIKAEKLLEECGVPRKTPLAISTQRSSFLLWDSKSGAPRTPLISWQDIRADGWCARQRNLAEEVRRITGLPLAANYAAPKLATLFQEEPELLALAKGGALLFGTLETYLIWHWTGGAHVTDVSVAARTLLVDLEKPGWSPRMLDLFGIPENILPRLRENPETQLETRLGYPITASLGDQGAGAFPLFEAFPHHAFLNTGTGTFCMRLQTGRAPHGFLTALLARPEDRPRQLLWEGPINAGAQLLGDEELGEDWFSAASDPIPEVFAVADSPGLAAPHWRKDLAGVANLQKDALDPEIQRRLALEALIFRAREVLEGLYPDEPPQRVLVSGGLTKRRDFLPALAALLPYRLHLLEEPEMSLWGAAWIGSGRACAPKLRTREVPLPPHRGYLPEKYRRWRFWMTSLTSHQLTRFPPLT